MNKQKLEEKKRGFFDEFSTVVGNGEGTMHFEFTHYPDQVWRWIEKLVEEVEKKEYKRGYKDRLDGLI